MKKMIIVMKILVQMEKGLFNQVCILKDQIQDKDQKRQSKNIQTMNMEMKKLMKLIEIRIQAN